MSGYKALSKDGRQECRGGGSVSGEAKSGGGGISICLDLRTWREEQRQLFVGVVGERWCGQMWEDVVICKAALGGLER